MRACVYVCEVKKCEGSCIFIVRNVDSGCCTSGCIYTVHYLAIENTHLKLL